MKKQELNKKYQKIIKDMCKSLDEIENKQGNDTLMLYVSRTKEGKLLVGSTASKEMTITIVQSLMFEINRHIFNRIKRSSKKIK